jgi:hypothetical protein
MKTLKMVSPLGRDSKPGPPRYEAGVLTIPVVSGGKVKVKLHKFVGA